MEKASQFLDEISQRMNELMKQSPVRDFEKNARAVLSAGLSRLEIVTREEFDVQADVLARTQERLKQLEQRLTQLEEKTK